MKRLSNFVLLLILSGFFACDTKTEINTGNAGKQKELLEANRAVQRAIETGDSATLAKYISEEAIDHGGGPDGGDVKGREIVRMLSSFHKDVDNLKFETLQEAANNDHVFALVRVTGTTNKPAWGMPAGYKMDMKSVDVIRLKDGKMVDHWAYMDMKDMMAMMQGQGGAAAPAAKDSAQ